MFNFMLTPLAHTKQLSTLFAGATILLSAWSTSTFAQSTDNHYIDVPAGAYYEESAAALLRSGALNPNETRLRPTDTATRAEVMQLLVRVFGSNVAAPASLQPSFADVSTSAWHFRDMEIGRREGWLKGDGDCSSGNADTCYARPLSGVSRAEMATILQRSFRLPQLSLSPGFYDNPAGTWYASAIQTAADHCVLRGDPATGLVRPASRMTRAEMIVMFDRAQQRQRYAQDCFEAAGNFESVDAVSSRELNVTFNVDINPDLVGQTRWYTLQADDNTMIDITNVRVANSRSVHLILAHALVDGSVYRLRVNGIESQNGNTFNALRTFTATLPISSFPQQVYGNIQAVTVVAADMVRVTFNSDLLPSYAQNPTLYTITSPGAGTPVVLMAVLVGSRTVELTLNQNLVEDVAYVVSVSAMQTSNGTAFQGSKQFVYGSLVATNNTVSLEGDGLLTGDQEVPSVTTSATGVGSYWLTKNGLQYDIIVQNLSSLITTVNLQSGGRGENGPVVRTIVFHGNRSTDIWTEITDEQRIAVMNGQLYVNVRTFSHPDGEIRGQIIVR